jgi:hypothetical protein
VPVQIIPPVEDQKISSKTRDIRAKAAGTNRTYIDNIKSLISQEAIDAPNFGETSEDIPGPNGGSRRSPLYLLDFDATMTLITAPNFGLSEYKDAEGDIKSLIDQGAINQSSFGLVDYTDAKGEKRPEYLLDFDATMTLITGNRQQPGRVIAVRDRYARIELCQFSRRWSGKEGWP